MLSEAGLEDMERQRNLGQGRAATGKQPEGSWTSTYRHEHRPPAIDSKCFNFSRACAAK